MSMAQGLNAAPLEARPLPQSAKNGDTQPSLLMRCCSRCWRGSVAKYFDPSDSQDTSFLESSSSTNPGWPAARGGATGAMRDGQAKEHLPPSASPISAAPSRSKHLSAPPKIEADQAENTDPLKSEDTDVLSGKSAAYRQDVFARPVGRRRSEAAPSHLEPSARRKSRMRSWPQRSSAKKGEAEDENEGSLRLSATKSRRASQTLALPKKLTRKKRRKRTCSAEPGTPISRIDSEDDNYTPIGSSEVSTMYLSRSLRDDSDDQARPTYNPNDKFKTRLSVASEYDEDDIVRRHSAATIEEALTPVHSAINESLAPPEMKAPQSPKQQQIAPAQKPTSPKRPAQVPPLNIKSVRERQAERGKDATQEAKDIHNQKTDTTANMKAQSGAGNSKKRTEHEMVSNFSVMKENSSSPGGRSPDTKMQSGAGNSKKHTEHEMVSRFSVMKENSSSPGGRSPDTKMQTIDEDSCTDLDEEELQKFEHILSENTPMHKLGEMMFTSAPSLICASLGDEALFEETSSEDDDAQIRPLQSDASAIGMTPTAGHKQRLSTSEKIEMRRKSLEAAEDIGGPEIYEPQRQRRLSAKMQGRLNQTINDFVQSLFKEDGRQKGNAPQGRFVDWQESLIKTFCDSTMLPQALEAAVDGFFRKAMYELRARGGYKMLQRISKLVYHKNFDDSASHLIIDKIFFDSIPKGRTSIVGIEQILKVGQLNRFLRKVIEEAASVEVCWHGTQEKYVDAIIQGGLQPDLCACGAFGRGAYVGTHAGVAHQYADPNEEGVRHILCTLVVVGGSLVKGTQGMQSENTACDRLLNPTQYCFVDADRLYCSHLVTYRCTGLTGRRTGGGYEDPFLRKLEGAMCRSAKNRNKAGMR